MARRGFFRRLLDRFLQPPAPPPPVEYTPPPVSPRATGMESLFFGQETQIPFTPPWEQRPPGWSPGEAEHFHQMAQRLNFYDPALEERYHRAFFQRGISAEDRARERELLKEFMLNNYGIDFDDVFDWIAWREAYAEH